MRKSILCFQLKLFLSFLNLFLNKIDNCLMSSSKSPNNLNLTWAPQVSPTWAPPGWGNLGKLGRCSQREHVTKSDGWSRAISVGLRPSRQHENLYFFTASTRAPVEAVKEYAFSVVPGYDGQTFWWRRPVLYIICLIIYVYLPCMFTCALVSVFPNITSFSINSFYL